MFLYLYNNVKFTLLYNINTKIKSTRIFSNAFCLTLIQKCFSTHRPKSELAEYPRYLYPALLSYHKFRQRQLVIPPFKSSKLATTSSTGGLLLALQRAIVTARPKGRYRKHFCWPAIKRYYSNLLVSILLLALLYTFELLHLLYCQSFQHNIL